MKTPKIGANDFILGGTNNDSLSTAHFEIFLESGEGDAPLRVAKNDSIGR